MSETVIRVENLGKKYIIGHQKQEQYTALRDVLANGAKSLVRTFSRSRDGSSKQVSEEFWALKDVSFDIKQGDRVGIIGRNGAGKSTLLKILSRITEPTTGSIRIKGRVASLLEVGTGFHPELTGRENIYLNGSILGMSRVEIKSKFDEIVAFAEIEKFLDTPVKRYSSGMYVRLAFAVAAHLQTDILVVDEVLAVGDAEFQKKCMGKMEEVSTGEGRTVLFVSHQLGAIKRLCERCLFLERGQVAVDALTHDALVSYTMSIEKSATQDLFAVTDRAGKGELRLVKLEVQGGPDLENGFLATGQQARFTFHLSGIRENMVVNFTIYDMMANPIFLLNSDNRSPSDLRDTSLRSLFLCDIDKLPLLPGRYRMHVNVGCDGVHQDGLESAATFEVGEGFFDGRHEVQTPYGVVTTSHRWTRPQ